MEVVSFHKLLLYTFILMSLVLKQLLVWGCLYLLVVQDRIMTSWRLDIGQILAGYMFFLLHTPLSFLSCCVGQQDKDILRKDIIYS